MRIARPKPHKPEFRRTRKPPPQATKLLRYTLVAGIVFMLLLGIVFLPRMFQDQSPVAIVTLRLDTTEGTRLEVTSVTAVLELAKFKATLSRGGVTYASLPAGLAGGSATLRFVDANVTGHMDVGDYFEIETSQTDCNGFEMFQVDVNRRVAFERWGAC